MVAERSICVGWFWGVAAKDFRKCASSAMRELRRGL